MDLTDDMRATVPQERLSAVRQIVQNVIMPLAPRFAELGISVDVRKLNEIISKYSDLPELTNVATAEQLSQGQVL